MKIFFLIKLIITVQNELMLQKLIKVNMEQKKLINVNVK
jgi:hypothetical protein